MRVNRREGYQTREERCLKKAMTKLIVEEQENWRLEKRGANNGDQNMEKQELWRLKCGEVRAKRKIQKGGKSVLRVE